ATLATLLRPLLDQELSIVFYDLTTIRAEGSTEMSEELRRFGFGTSQDSCRLIHATNCAISSAFTCSRTTASRSGLSVTAPTGVQ
ncbi:hypothetical protein GO611_23895, partial [Azoarcus communis SWub3 = DSM 12120]|nr:hypothetical protein [Parazoarcus communis SWub3 = DSM 12120]